ncbi:MAG: signal peptidase I [Clostridia bacterium]|nr:signal peptidase I [Clostridia bacterium]
MKNKTNERKKRTPLQVLGDLFTTVILLAVAALLILFLGVRLVGITPYAVQTASMEPTYPVGSIIYVKNVAANDVKVGDAITYTLNSEGLLATHRVTKIDTGRQLFYTHGDAVEGVEDTPVPFGALVGIPKFSIPKLGFLAQYVATKQGRVIAVTAAAILLVLAIFPQLLSSAEKSDRKKKEEEEKAKAAASPPEPPATRETDPPE